MTSKQVLTYDTVTLDAGKITEEKDPHFGDMTVFHDVVIASEIVQPYEDGRAWKPRDELEAYAPYVEGAWVMLGGHPEEGIISTKDQVSGRTVNARFVKNLIDHKTKRPTRAGVRADMQFFHKFTPPQTLEDMKNGKKQDVSIGFFFTKDDTPGVVENDSCKGEEYDYVQRNMFHNHVAAGIDNGRCPMPFCGLGADEIGSRVAGDPFAGFVNWADCVAKVKEKNPELSDEQAEAICGKLKSEYEDNKVEDDALRKSLREVAQMILDEMEEIKGMKQAVQEQKKDEKEWYFAINWREEPFKMIYDCLNEDVRTLLTEKGLCPHCPGDEDKEEPCEEGYEKNEKGECVKKEETEEEPPKEDETPPPQEDVLPPPPVKDAKLDPREVLKRFREVMSRGS